MEHTLPAPVVQDSIRSVVDTAPSFPGGEEGLRRYFRERLVYPEHARELGSEGFVVVVFTVLADGHLTDIRIGASDRLPELEGEALRSVRGMPNWVPARVNGSMVAAHASVLVPFHIRD